MEVPTFILSFVLVASVAAFTIPDGKYESDYSRSNSSLVTAGNEVCKCKNGRCVKDNRGISKCNCPPGYALQGESICEVCNCGKSGKCTFLPQSKSTGGLQYEKKCFCDQGFAEKNGLCIDCHCGDNSKCEFEGEEKICYCIDRYSELKGVCTECDCGFFGECKFVSGLKKCICDEGYVEDDGTCKVDYCKQNCGEIEGVACDESKRFDENVECTCIDDSKSFDLENKVCNVDYCKKNCGINEDVECDEMRKFDENVKCTCKDQTKGFDEQEKTCRDCSCGLQSDGCRFKGENKICKCVVGYTQKDGICKVKCSFNLPCQNGGLCDEGVCVCLPGTSGDFCEVIDDCKDLCPQQSDINCTYDIKDHRAFCNCSEKNKGFHPETKNCRAICDDGSSFCRNGGKCTDINYSRLCTCLPGTRGDFCELVPECEEKDCGNDAYCWFDTSLESAICECRDGNLNFDPEDRRCKRTCGDTFQCMNGGACEEDEYRSKFCRCLEGTKGDFCDEVTGCKAKDCGEHASCKYDVVRRIAVCVCDDETYVFDPTVYKCRRTCGDSFQCMNGGACEEDEYRSKFCRCLEGTKGDFCDEVTGCNAKDCGEHARCKYDVVRRMAVCVCDDETYVFDPTVYKCRKNCTGDADCHNGGSCKSKGNSKFCNCLPGTTGDVCEIVEECENDPGMCKGESTCIYDITRKKAFCQCPDGPMIQYDPLDQTCKDTCFDGDACLHEGLCLPIGDYHFCRCKVGIGGHLCEIVNDCERGVCGDLISTTCDFDIETEIVKCGCVDANSLFDVTTKTCKKKWCVEKQCEHGKCEIIDDKEECSCFEGYELEGDYCRKLNCSKTLCLNGTCVVRHGNVEECVCQAGFTLSGGLCLRGLCRIDTCYGGHCEIVNDELTCVCPYRFHWDGVGCYETVCEKQRCFGGKCVVEEGEEICTCLDGYILENDACKKIICEKKNCFGGKCNIVDGVEECTCPSGFSLFEDVCREDFTLGKNF